MSVMSAETMQGMTRCTSMRPTPAPASTAQRKINVRFSGTTSTNDSGDVHQGCTGLIWHVTLEDQHGVHGLDGQCATCVANIGLSYGGFIDVPLVVPGSVRYQVASMGITMVGSAQKLGSKALQRVVTHTVYD